MTRAAIVGSGLVARVHAYALRELGVEVAGVSSRTLVGAETLVAELGEGTAYPGLADALADETVGVVHICTPNHVHAEQTLAALERGRHVVCEKPLAVNARESARMVEECSRRGVVGATAYHVRGYPLVEHMRAEIAAGRLGEVRAVHGRYFCDDGLADVDQWRLDPERSGPSYVTADLGVHWLDLSEHVTGAHVVEVLAEFRTFTPGRPLEDFATLLLRFDSGAVGSLALSAVTAGRKNQLLFECEGDRGGFTWDQERPDVLLHRVAGEPSRVVVKDPATNAGRARELARFPAGHGEGYGDAFRNLLRAVYAAIAGERDSEFPTFADGHRGMRLLDAAVASAQARAWVGVE